MPVPNLSGIQPWQYRLPPEYFNRPSPYGDLIKALMGAGDQYSDYLKEKTNYDVRQQSLGMTPGYAESGQPNVNQIGQVPNGPVKNQGFVQSPFAPEGQGFVPNQTKLSPLDLFKAKEQIKSQYKTSGGGMLGGKELTDEQKDIYAKMINNNSLTPEAQNRLMGFGGSKAGQYADVMSRVNEMRKEQGQPEYSPAEFNQQYKYAVNTKVQMLNQNLNTIDGEMKKLSELNDNFKRTKYPLLNKAILGLGVASGSEDATKWRSAVKLFQDTFNNVLKTGTPTDQTLRLAVEALSPDLGADQFNGVMNDVVKAFIAYRQDPLNFQTGNMMKKYNAPSNFSKPEKDPLGLFSK